MFREQGAKQHTAEALCQLGHLASHQGNYRQAAARFQESLALLGEAGDKRDVARCLAGRGGLAVAEGQPECAARLLGAAAALLRNSGARLQPIDEAAFDRSVTAARTALGEDAFAAAWAEGRAMTLQQAMTYALEAAAPEGAGNRSDAGGKGAHTPAP
jgi:tetratricopeptide (TPR) repeat protein